ncbi:formate dehydrogenase accessory sulfurtransferase FdhD [Nocardioides sp.]|uniref:formate dehydrogenase accessory sulfurtransferase FdhD n=1 Tax=Nocardioides sp. TaxID=35761 RepID=UPI003D11C991
MRGRRPGPTVRTRVREVTAAGEVLREDRLATEEPLEIRLAWPGRRAERLWVTMRTPGNDFELAAGFLHHEGLHGIDTVAYCTDVDLRAEQEFNVVTVTLSAPPAAVPALRSAGLSAGSSACGVCGVDSIEAALRIQPSKRPGFELDTGVARVLPDALRGGQQVFERTGGLHAAGLFSAAGEPWVIREDIGRHNAVDKVVGVRVLGGQSPAAPYLCVSGRIGFELVQKAVASGVGALVAVGAPSSLAVHLAREAGLGLVGFTRPERCVVYVG